ADKRNAWREAVEQCANMLAMDPYPGFDGQFFSMPARNIVPKPVQKPHPPLWVACSNRETIKLAARLGIGALTFAFVDPAEATQWVEDYYRIFKEECVPIGHAVNPNICMVSSFGVHQDAAEARRRFQDGFRFFQFALGWHYGFGEQVPGRTDIWEKFQAAMANMDPAAAPGGIGGAAAAEGGIGTPDQLRNHLRKFDECGVDQVAFIQQGGRNRHEHICEALELFAGEVMGEFKEREAERVKQKAEDLAPFVEAAFKRKSWMKPLADDEIPQVLALGRKVAEEAAARGEAPPQPTAARAAWREALEASEGKKKA
ncbi:MAG TPA: LLM class flavin-dependent oxidoreductase, partial [Caulobacteraceae bacterium]|nr:LLM class flavin-dependent oxidoreductase [Caulobacteraceae bacterium]